MRKAIIIICTVLSGLLILDSINAGHSLMMFLLAGIIPGTTIAISAQQMMEVFALLIGFTLSRVVTYLIRSIQDQFAIDNINLSQRQPE